MNLRSYSRERSNKKLNNLSEYNLNLEWDSNNDLSISQIIDLLSTTCSKVSFIRIDRSPNRSNLVVQIGLFEETNIEELIKKLTNYNADLNVQIFSNAIDW